MHTCDYCNSPSNSFINVTLGDESVACCCCNTCAEEIKSFEALEDEDMETSPIFTGIYHVTNRNSSLPLHLQER